MSEQICLQCQLREEAVRTIPTLNQKQRIGFSRVREVFVVVHFSQAADLKIIHLRVFISLTDILWQSGEGERLCP